MLTWVHGLQRRGTNGPPSLDVTVQTVASPNSLESTVDPVASPKSLPSLDVVLEFAASPNSPSSLEGTLQAPAYPNSPPSLGVVLQTAAPSKGGQGPGVAPALGPLAPLGGVAGADVTMKQGDPAKGPNGVGAERQLDVVETGPQGARAAAKVARPKDNGNHRSDAPQAARRKLKVASRKTPQAAIDVEVGNPMPGTHL